MIGLPQNQSTKLARCPYVWCRATCASNSQKTENDHQYTAKLATIRPPNSPPKPKQVAISLEISRLNQLMLARKTSVQTPPFAKSP
jgi:hypothetical protein